ncbi:Wall-associated receptor kinase-like 14 [Nymphaea thermarum]|nr:Wall-associated receptor kinase-like 14 [Nymphaea thermarum]
MKFSIESSPAMMKPIRLETIVLIIVFDALLLPSIAVQNCNRRCGSRNVPYPFGFSGQCPVKLLCQEDHITFHGLPVLNFTADSVILEFPMNCSRPFQHWRDFFGPSYALTSQNGLLLSNCSSLVSNCVLSGPLITERLGIGCPLVNVTCFSDDSGGFVNKSLVSGLKCDRLLSSLTLDDQSMPVKSLDFQTVEVGWWLENINCSACSPDSNCSRIKSPATGQRGFICKCNEGFVGDGFVDGDGCQKISSSCNPSKYMSGRCGGTARIGVLIGGLVAGALVMALVGFLFFCIRWRRSSRKSRMSAKHLLSKAAGSFTVPLYTYKEIDKATTGFSEKQRLGTGAYGTVYAGKLHNDEWVAIKKIRHRDMDGIEPFMNEIKLLSSVSHPNLVRLLGWCVDRGEQILVYEFMPNGTLAQHLQRERGEGLSWPIRLEIAAETAHAIAHLHSAIDPPIYHRDIKSSNILLDYNFKSKVADFGLSRMVSTETSHISTAPQGTPGYLDPQYHQNFHLSDKSDVYSFGVVLVEIITAMKVVDFSRSNNEINLAALAIDKIGKGRVEDIIDPLLEPQKDAWTLSTVHKVAELAFRCLAFHRDMRPSMLEVAVELDNMRFSFNDNKHELSPCSSMSSARSQLPSMVKHTGNINLVVPHMVLGIPAETEMSPLSVQESWFSEQSSPSSSSLLDNVVQ